MTRRRSLRDRERARRAARGAVGRAESGDSLFAGHRAAVGRPEGAGRGAGAGSRSRRDRPGTRACRRSSRTARARVRLGRALALDPQVLLLEHPTAAVPREDVEAFGRQIRRIVQARGAAALTLTADRDVRRSAMRRVLTLEPSTGRLTERAVGLVLEAVRVRRRMIVRGQTPNCASGPLSTPR